MNKTLIFILLMCLLAGGLLSGCAVKETPAELKNVIAPKTLSADQQDIVHLLSSDSQEILLFDFQTEETYKSVEFWVEVYEYGVLSDRPAGLHSRSGEATTRNGQLAVLITQNPDYEWTLTLSEGGSRSSHIGGPAEMADQYARAYGPIVDPAEIEDGKEIVLYDCIFSDGNILSYSDLQCYVDEPEIMRGYPYVHLIKCRFSK